MLMSGGSSVTPIGFRRSEHAPNVLAGTRAIDLGRTADGMLAMRALSVAATLAALGRMSEQVRGADVILARNLEMLAIAVCARHLYAADAPIVYECLDIHRLLLANNVQGRLIRSIESRLWKSVDLLLTSSEAFARNYFEPRRFPAPIRTVENKVLLPENADSSIIMRPPPGPPWRIGWFGIIRCRQSLKVLSAVARAAGGAVEVIIRGRPSAATFADFASAVAGLPHVRFAGPYRNPDELPAIHSDVHFIWAIDYYESGQNSAWLLPNRIYEGSLYGGVPIAVADVETGNWLTKHGLGVVLADPLEERLAELLLRLDAGGYSQLADRVAALPRRTLVCDQTECRELVEAMWRCRAADQPRAPREQPRHAWFARAKARTARLG